MKVPFIFSVPFVNIHPITVVPPSLPSGIDISALFFRGIKPYRDYDLLDEVLRQYDHLDEREKNYIDDQMATQWRLHPILI